MARDYDRAIQSARKAIEMDPNFLLAHRVLGLAYEYRGRHDEATAEFTRGVELSHGDPVAKAFLARSYAAAGHKDQATKILNELLQLSLPPGSTCLRWRLPQLTQPWAEMKKLSAG